MQDAGINVFHVAVVAPVLGYVGYTAYNNEPVGVNMGIALMIAAIIVLVFHLWRIYEKTMGKEGMGCCGVDTGSANPTVCGN